MKAANVYLIGLLFAFSAWAEPLLEGWVRLDSGEPVADARVQLFDLTDLRRGAIARAMTDGTGYFSLPLAALTGQVLPARFALGPNYPNPFNPSTIIPYQLAASSEVRLEVFNLLGQRIATLVDGERSAGFHTATWDAVDAGDRAVGAGVYIYRMTVGAERQTGRMVLLDGQAGASAAGAASVWSGVSSGDGSTGGDTQVYGLIVSGEGLAPYVDSSFRVEAGMVPVELVVSSGHSGGKAVDDDCAFCDLFDGLDDEAEGPGPSGKAQATLAAPPAPTNLRFDAVTDSSCTVRWAGAAGATDYDVNYKPAVGGQWTNEPHRGTGLSNTIHDLEPGTEYRWAVRAENGDGRSAWVFGPNFTTLEEETDEMTQDVAADGQAPAAPTNLRFDAVTDSSCTVRWAGAAGATDYDVNYKLAVGGRWTNEPHRGTELYNTIDDLQPNTEYRWAVRAENSEGTSEWIYGPNFTTLEEEETDNTSNEGGPNLIVQSPSASAVTLTPGQAFTLQVTVQNQGDAQAEATMLHYYRSNNATITASDTEVGTNEVGSLAVSRIRNESISLIAPSAPGTYYYGACVASVSGESDTPNNCSTGVRVIVEGDSPDLTRLIWPPEHMANVWWYWSRDSDPSSNKLHKIRELEINFTIHNDPGDFSDKHGLYLMLCYSFLSDVGFYFGLQTDVNEPGKGGRGKGLIISRWETRDLAKARVADAAEGWTESSGHEGDFIGVRRAYDWGTGDYRVRFAPDGSEADGEWFGVWITDKARDETTWIGSLKFPYLNGEAVISYPSIYTTMEIYGASGSPIKAIDIPEWYVSVKRPSSNGVKPVTVWSFYSTFTSEVLNSNVRYDPTDDAMHFQAGGSTERTNPEQTTIFD